MDARRALARAGLQLYQFHASGAHTQRANSILAALSRDSGPTIAEELGALQPALRGTEPSSEVVTRFLRAHTAQFNYLDPHHRLPSIFYDLARYKYSWLTFKCTRIVSPRPPWASGGTRPPPLPCSRRRATPLG